MTNNKLIQLGVLMDKAQMKAIDKAAKQVGLSRSAYVRFVLMQHLINIKQAG